MPEIKDGRVTLLVNDDRVTIEFHDTDSGIQAFAKATMTTAQFCQALSRISNTPCSLEVRHLERVGKIMEHRTWKFEIPANAVRWIGNQKDLTQVREIASATCPDGWTPDLSFGSLNSFYAIEDKHYAMTTIRRWVNPKI